MKNAYWITIAAGALIVGILLGYSFWGSSAAKLPEVEKQLSSVQVEFNEFKKKAGDLEANLGKITNEKLNLEKELATFKEAAAKAAKKGR